MLFMTSLLLFAAVIGLCDGLSHRLCWCLLLYCEFTTVCRLSLSVSFLLYIVCTVCLCGE